jgi:hypothetical protein
LPFGGSGDGHEAAELVELWHSLYADGRANLMSIARALAITKSSQTATEVIHAAQATSTHRQAATESFEIVLGHEL